MFYEEITVTDAYNLSPHRHAFINPYNGCSMGCPFCFWLSQEGWENRIQIKTNIAACLEEELKAWPRDEFIYLGSVCDPFNELEEQYQLTRQCLELIKQYEIPLLITTSGVDEVILKYLDLLKSIKSRVVLVIELARIPQIESLQKSGFHAGIAHANQFFEAGLEVWTTLAPLIPGVIELEPVLDAINPAIPVYIDGLQCQEGSVQSDRIMEWIARDYPECCLEIETIIKHQEQGYFDRILEAYCDNQRIQKFPFKL